MKLLLASALFLACVSLAFGANGVPGVEKISSSVVNYFGDRYVFYSPTFPSAGSMLIYMTMFSPYQNYGAFEDYEPSWANISASVDSTPDINVLNVANTLLYFTAMDKETKRTAIGVARCTKIETNPGYPPFTPKDEPLLKSVNGENLSRPSLDKDENGDLYLYYHNTSSHWSVGQIQRVKLTKNGMDLAEEPEFL